MDPKVGGTVIEAMPPVAAEGRWIGFSDFGPGFARDGVGTFEVHVGTPRTRTHTPTAPANTARQGARI